MPTLAARRPNGCCSPKNIIPISTAGISFSWARLDSFCGPRYWSIDQLLADLPIKNILELSSGVSSTRGLDAVQRQDIHYIDTDLPGVTSVKRDFVAALQGDDHPRGTLEILPLNALDEEQFGLTVSRFPAGPLAIVNEGLLMYLGIEEKERLCRIIHKILGARGGYWITADIYIKRPDDEDQLKTDDQIIQIL